MRTSALIKRMLVICLSLLFILPSVAIASTGTDQNSAASSSTDNQPVIYLGKIAVHGERNIVRVLQAIKISLQQPYSSDPRLKNVVVCRLENTGASHFNQTLSCAPNWVWAKRRAATQTAMVGIGDPGDNVSCTTPACYNQLSQALGDAMSAAPDQTLHAQVNGPGFRGLLHKIPYPEWYMKSATPAPAAATNAQ